MYIPYGLVYNHLIGTATVAVAVAVATHTGATVSIKVRAIVTAVAVAAAVLPWATVSVQATSCAPVSYSTTRDGDAGYWARWDALRAAGYHAHAGQVGEQLWPRGC